MLFSQFQYFICYSVSFSEGTAPFSLPTRVLGSARSAYSGPEGADGNGLSIANMGAKGICPQTRTLTFWAAKYFTIWLASKDTFESANPVRVRARGWKDGTMVRFFELKDQIFQENYLDHDNPELGE